jgi:hypothetical protein
MDAAGAPSFDALAHRRARLMHTPSLLLEWYFKQWRGIGAQTGSSYVMLHESESGFPYVKRDCLCICCGTTWFSG